MGVFVVAGEARLGFVERQPGQQRDAIEGLLAVGDYVVAERLDRLARERLVEAFDFLQADDVRRALLQPSQQQLDPLPDRIDVPGGDAHEYQFQVLGAARIRYRSRALLVCRGIEVKLFIHRLW